MGPPISSSSWNGEPTQGRGSRRCRLLARSHLACARSRWPRYRLALDAKLCGVLTCNDVSDSSWTDCVVVVVGWIQPASTQFFPLDENNGPCRSPSIGISSQRYSPLALELGGDLRASDVVLVDVADVLDRFSPDLPRRRDLDVVEPSVRIETHFPRSSPKPGDPRRPGVVRGQREKNLLHRLHVPVVEVTLLQKSQVQCVPMGVFDVIADDSRLLFRQC